MSLLRHLHVHLAFIIVATGCAGCQPPERELLDMPEHPSPERTDAGPVTSDPGATCETGDGCDVTCPLLDADCSDGETCSEDGLCTPACHVFDSDCSRVVDGRRCLFGEECDSGRCIFVDVDDEAVCTRACAVDAPCAEGLQCFARTDRDESICLAPSSCAAGSATPLALAGLAIVNSRRRASPRKSPH